MSSSSKEFVDTEETAEAEEVLADPGGMLSIAREAQGISIARIARELGLTESAVKALEANKHDHFPAGIYVRGYIKNYCKVLELNPDNIMEMLEKFITRNGTLASHGSNYDPLGEFGRGSKKKSPFIVPVILAILALVAYTAYRVFWS